MTISIGADRAGYATKQDQIQLVEKLGHTGHHVRTFTPDGPDGYSDCAILLSRDILSGAADRSIRVRGSGFGVCVPANKFTGIRDCVCHDEYSPQQGLSTKTWTYLFWVQVLSDKCWRRADPSSLGSQIQW